MFSFFVKQCSDIYGPKFNEALLEGGVSQSNIIYGGLGIEVRKVVFPNGSIDPWHALGVLQDVNSEAPAVYIQGQSLFFNNIKIATTYLSNWIKRTLTSALIIW